jgi:hypothetical protein
MCHLFRLLPINSQNVPSIARVTAGRFEVFDSPGPSTALSSLRLLFMHSDSPRVFFGQTLIGERHSFKNRSLKARPGNYPIVGVQRDVRSARRLTNLEPHQPNGPMLAPFRNPAA